MSTCFSSLTDSSAAGEGVSDFSEIVSASSVPEDVEIPELATGSSDTRLSPEFSDVASDCFSVVSSIFVCCSGAADSVPDGCPSTFGSFSDLPSSPAGCVAGDPPSETVSVAGCSSVTVVSPVAESSSFESDSEGASGAGVTASGSSVFGVVAVSVVASSSASDVESVPAELDSDDSSDGTFVVLSCFPVSSTEVSAALPTSLEVVPSTGASSFSSAFGVVPEASSVEPRVASELPSAAGAPGVATSEPVPASSISFSEVESAFGVADLATSGSVPFGSDDSVGASTFGAGVSAFGSAGLATSDSVTSGSGASIAPGCSSLFSGVVGASVFGSVDSTDSSASFPVAPSEPVPSVAFSLGVGVAGSVDSAPSFDTSVADGCSSTFGSFSDLPSSLAGCVAGDPPSETVSVAGCSSVTVVSPAATSSAFDSDSDGASEASPVPPEVTSEVPSSVVVPVSAVAPGVAPSVGFSSGAVDSVDGLDSPELLVAADEVVLSVTGCSSTVFSDSPSLVSSFVEVAAGAVVVSVVADVPASDDSFPSAPDVVPASFTS